MKNIIKILFLIVMCTTFAAGCTKDNANDEKNSLETAIHSAVLEYNGEQNSSKDIFACESHIILDKKEDSDRIVVYAMVMYHEYTLQGSDLLLVSGSHMPTALTFAEKSGNYELEEYWITGDGEDYAVSIKEKFPDKIYEDAVNTQKFVKEQIDSCKKQAAEHFDIAKED